MVHWKYDFSFEYTKSRAVNQTSQLQDLLIIDIKKIIHA